MVAATVPSPRPGTRSVGALTGICCIEALLVRPVSLADVSVECPSDHHQRRIRQIVNDAPHPLPTCGASVFRRRGRRPIVGETGPCSAPSLLELREPILADVAPAEIE